MDTLEEVIMSLGTFEAEYALSLSPAEFWEWYRARDGRATEG